MLGSWSTTELHPQPSYSIFVTCFKAYIPFWPWFRQGRKIKSLRIFKTA
jgi:hypothetical protein